MVSKFEAVPTCRFLGDLNPGGFLSLKDGNHCSDFFFLSQSQVKWAGTRPHG